MDSLTVKYRHFTQSKSKGTKLDRNGREKKDVSKILYQLIANKKL
jgi:hypothetical protein